MNTANFICIVFSIYIVFIKITIFLLTSHTTDVVQAEDLQSV